MPRSVYVDEESDTASTETLLKDYEKSPQDFEHHRRRWNVCELIALHATAIIVYGIVATLIATRVIRNGRGQNLIYSPANEVIEYGKKVYSPHLKGDPDYFGPPSDEIDANWEELMYPSTMHLTQADREHFDPDSPMVQFPDGTYSGQLMVYHELHCLKRLYQFIYMDYYFPNLTDHDREMNRMHTAHCLGTLRQGVMCHGDVSVMTMVWGKYSREPLGDFSNPHQCVNFEKLHAWASQRAVTDALEPGVLVHPTLGPSFPDGQGTKIGFGDKDIDENGNIITLNSPDR